MRFPERFAGGNVGLVLSGGNIDLRLLASVLQRELVREKRLVTYRILGDDRPGMLSRMADIIRYICSASFLYSSSGLRWP